MGVSVYGYMGIYRGNISIRGVAWYIFSCIYICVCLVCTLYTLP